jgi:hypothetical protein
MHRLVGYSTLHQPCQLQFLGQSSAEGNKMKGGKDLKSVANLKTAPKTVHLPKVATKLTKQDKTKLNKTHSSNNPIP